MLIVPAAASAASRFYIRGGGNGHGIGMSQYGAYGYALHGKDYRWILGHYYEGTTIANIDPNRIVRVLLATGRASFGGASRAGDKPLRPLSTYSVHLRADGSLGLVDGAGKLVGRFAAPLTVSGSGPLDVGGLGGYRRALEFRPDGAGAVETIETVGLDDYVRGVISAEMPASWSSEALETQAVAARTYAITTNVGGGAFDVYSDTRSQMYQGIAAETPSTDCSARRAGRASPGCSCRIGFGCSPPMRHSRRSSRLRTPLFEGCTEASFRPREGPRSRSRHGLEAAAGEQSPIHVSARGADTTCDFWGPAPSESRTAA